MGNIISTYLGKKIQGLTLGSNSLAMKIKTFIHSFLGNQTILFVIGGLIPPALNLLFLPIYSLYLSPEDFGIYAYTNAFQSIFIVFSTLSINSYLLRF